MDVSPGIAGYVIKAMVTCTAVADGRVTADPIQHIVGDMGRKGWSTVFFIVLISVGAAIWALIETLVDYMQSRACPTGSFASGSLHWAAVLTHLPAFPVSLALAWCVASYCFFKLPWDGAKKAAVGSTIGARYGTSFEFPSFQSSMRYKSFVLCCLLAVGVPLTIYKLYAGVCAWPGGLSTRDSSFSRSRFFGWADVRVLLTGCSGKGRDQSGIFVTLAMKYGTIIPLPLRG